ncbi:MAG TPA: YnbE family lipoprotein [Caulobacteraceae bacterium]
MTKRGLIAAMAAGITAVSIGACTPTVRVKVDPINIYAKLDADVRVRLDKEVQALIQQNPNLF